MPGDAAQGLVEADPAANVATVPIEHVGSCVEQIKFGAYTGDAIWSQVWSDLGESEAGAGLYCSQVGSDDPAKLLAIHEGWLQTQVFLAAKSEPEVVAPAPACDPNYEGCVPIASDVDCAGGNGNGPAYVEGPVRVIGSDPYDLDDDGDGWGC